MSMLTGSPLTFGTLDRTDMGRKDGPLSANSCISEPPIHASLKTSSLDVGVKPRGSPRGEVMFRTHALGAWRLYQSAARLGDLSGTASEMTRSPTTNQAAIRTSDSQD